MAMIPLSAGFKLVSEGQHIFRITDVDYNEDFGKLKIKMETKEGEKHTESFNLLNANGEFVNGAVYALTLTARAAMDDEDLQEVDPETLVGHFLSATVEHEEVNGRKYARLRDKAASNGWEVLPDGDAEEENTTGSVDLGSIFDGL